MKAAKIYFQLKVSVQIILALSFVISVLCKIVIRIKIILVQKYLKWLNIKKSSSQVRFLYKLVLTTYCRGNDQFFS